MPYANLVWFAWMTFCNAMSKLLSQLCWKVNVLLKLYFYTISSSIPVLLGNLSGKDAEILGEFTHEFIRQSAVTLCTWMSCLSCLSRTSCATSCACIIFGVYCTSSSSFLSIWLCTLILYYVVFVFNPTWLARDSRLQPTNRTIFRDVPWALCQGHGKRES